MTTMYALLLASLLDLMLGDPRGMPHPVRLIGWWITRCEQILRKILPAGESGERIGGVLLVPLVTIFPTLAAIVIVTFAQQISPTAAILAQGVLGYTVLAARSLHDESMAVFAALMQGGLSEAQAVVARIVGRDTDVLDESGVVKAAVETVAENASDGVVAPMLFFAIGGAPLAFFYKAVNTMDSMVGYQNDRYRYFGCAAAKLDDLLNWIPSRICALLMVPAAALCRLDARGAFRIWRRDSRNHPSPNSAQTEAACAGALGVSLGGDAVYGGQLFQKPTIGDAQRPIEPLDIFRANRLMLFAAAFALAICTAVRLLIF